MRLKNSPPPDGQIACQYKPTRNIMARFLFELQVVAFVILKKARCTAVGIFATKSRNMIASFKCPYAESSPGLLYLPPNLGPGFFPVPRLRCDPCLFEFILFDAMRWRLRQILYKLNISRHRKVGHSVIAMLNQFLGSSYRIRPEYNNTGVKVRFA